MKIFQGIANTAKPFDKCLNDLFRQTQAGRQISG